jgi:putative two-component system response regulator
MNVDQTPHRTPVLVVDDDPFCREMLRSVLESLGYPVEMASDGKEALELVYRGDFRIILSDWQMPEMSGVELCSRVRNRHLSGYVYFILLTCLNRRENLVAGLSAGADDFINKPFDPEELKIRLRAAERIISLEGRDLLIFSLAKLAEARDPETGAHLERMREYARLLAHQLSTLEKYRRVIDADYVRTIFMTSPLHDIGKVGIPDRVLLKPGKLTREEFDVMKLHVQIGSTTLGAAIQNNSSAEYLRFGQQIVISHHEKFDGTGYPFGLAGENIPLCGRIVALADVYDALTTKRVYKDAFTHEQARAIILQGAGAHFDPDVVDAFLKQESEFVRIKDQLREDESLPSAAALWLPAASSELSVALA